MKELTDIEKISDNKRKKLNDSEKKDLFEWFKRRILSLFLSFVTISSTVSYFFLLPYVERHKRIHSFFENTLSELAVTAAVALFVTLSWKKVEAQEKKDEHNEISNLLLKDIGNFWENEKPKLLVGIQDKLHSGLKQGSVDEVFEKAAEYIETCTRIRVIGTAKQNDN